MQTSSTIRTVANIGNVLCCGIASLRSERSRAAGTSSNRTICSRGRTRNAKASNQGKIQSTYGWLSRRSAMPGRKQLEQRDQQRTHSLSDQHGAQQQSMQARRPPPKQEIKQDPSSKRDCVKFTSRPQESAISSAKFLDSRVLRLVRRPTGQTLTKEDAGTRLKYAILLILTWALTWAQWQKDRKDASCVVGLRPAFHLNRSSVLADNLRAYPKAKTSASIPLRADKWLEEHFPNGRLNSASAIREGQTDAWTGPIAAFMCIGCTNPQSATSL